MKKHKTIIGVSALVLATVLAMLSLSSCRVLEVAGADAQADADSVAISAYDEICSILNIPPEPAPTYDPNVTLDDYYDWQRYLDVSGIEHDSEVAEEWKAEKLEFEKRRYKSYVEEQASISGSQRALVKRSYFTEEEADVFINSNFFTSTFKELTRGEMFQVGRLMVASGMRPDGYDISTYYDMSFQMNSVKHTIVPHISYYIVDDYMIVLCTGVRQSDIDEYYETFYGKGISTIGRGEDVDGQLVTKTGVFKYELDNLPEWVTQIMKDTETCEQIYNREYFISKGGHALAYIPEYHIPYTQLKDFPFIDNSQK